MKHTILTTIAGIGIALAMTSCDDTWEAKLQQEGSIKLSSVGVEVESESSRTGVDVSNFIVAINQGSKEVCSYQYSEMPEIVTLPVGDYTISAKSHQVEKAAWSAPYYLGDKAFSIASGKIVEIGTITCVFSNVAVTIKYDEDLYSVMGDDCKVTVVVNDEGRLDYTKEETRTGYFKAVDGSTTMVVTFSGTVDGNKRTLAPQTYTDVAAGSHYTITYSLKNGDPTVPVDPSNPEEGGTITVTDPTSGISIATFVSTGVDEEISGGVDVSGDDDEDVVINPGVEPGTEEPETPVDPGTDPGTDPTTPPAADPIWYKPCDGLSLEKENSVDVDSVIVYLHADNGFAHLNVEINSDNAAFLASAGELLPLSFDLATVTGVTATNLASIGLPVGPYPATQTDIEFNVTDLVPLLGAFPGHHAFNLTIVDNLGNEKSLTLKFVAE